ncbi:hypothetical protein OH786_11355 [Streptomyces atratus]|uniref:Uncharacterized protein n=1 Tax=Streptomyces atratus TaxID=1893 RepID=A0A1K2F3Q6_STRAR|nr:hypothetical protein [Streptomyces atratus]SFY42455.1 hypothetical protein SAMN02787144_103052 [Streptomyces atratus]
MPAVAKRPLSALPGQVPGPAAPPAPASGGPLTSEPPLADAIPLTSEPPLADATPLTSEPPLAVNAPLISEPAMSGAAWGTEFPGV